jgi:dihydrodipicolinate synthase/N-acetylneuraminate lyase
VPWTPDFALDEPVFRASIRRLLAAGIPDLYVFGTAGEGYAVHERQFDEVVAIFTEEMRTVSAQPMVGIISPSLSTVIERVERCLERGVDLFQISLPSWGTLTTAELRTFFAETCGRFPQARFLHYNLPRAGRLVTVDEYVTLAETHPNLVATKNAGATVATIGGLLGRVGQVRHFLTEPGYLAGWQLGEPGFLASIASMNPALARAYFAAGVRGDAVEVGRLGRELAGLSELLHEAPGGVSLIDGAYDKVFCKLLDQRFPLHLLPPYADFGEAAFKRFRSSVTERFPHWLPA